MKIKMFEAFSDDQMSGIFKSLHGAINKEDLVPLSELIGKPRFPTQEEVDVAVEYLGIDKDYLFYDEENMLNPIIYWKGPFYYGFHGLGMDVLKMMRAKEYFEQKNKFLEDNLKKKDYRHLFIRIDKKILISYFLEAYEEIPDNQKYDVFTDLYTRSEYGFEKFPKKIIEDLFSKRKMSSDWAKRMEEFKKYIKDKDIIKIYRGENKVSNAGDFAYSWTLSKKTADFFANRFSKGSGKILTKEIKSDQVLDYLKDRGESEVLIMPSNFLKENIDMNLKRIKLFEEFEPEPLAIAFLGSPASGKGYSKKLITKIEKLVHLARATDPEIGMDLTVDILRGKILELPHKDQLDLFYMAFYTLKDMAEESGEYSKWFDDIKEVWNNKISKLTDLEIEVNDKELKINGKIGEEALKELDKADSKKIISSLDDYKDYKRIVRAYQHIKQKEAEGTKKDVVYDEVGDEPEKIINKLKKLHDKDYVTDVIMVHHDDVTTNLLQNAARMITGTDGGRDSSENIIDAYVNIDKNINKYSINAEVSVNTTNKELTAGTSKAQDELAIATAKDNEERGQKPIDVFVKTKGEPLHDVFDRIVKDFNQDQKDVIKALLKYQSESKKINVPEKSKDVIQKLIGDMSNREALDILDDANSGKLKGNYVYKFGGVSDKLLKDAKEILK